MSAKRYSEWMAANRLLRVLIEAPRFDSRWSRNWPIVAASSVLEHEFGRRYTLGFLDEAEQEAECVSIGGHGVGARVSLCRQANGEERFHGGCQGGHCCAADTRRPAAA